MITVDSPIFGRGGTVDEAFVSLNGGASEWTYIKELHRICRLAGVDFRVAFAQFCHETAGGTSPRWINNRNPAGLGIAADDDPDPANFTEKEAAAVHVWALQRAAGGNAIGELPERANEFRLRWENKYRDPNCPTVRTVADLGKHYVDKNGEPQATWGWDPDYSAAIVRKANAIFKGATPVSTVYQIVGLPGPGIALPVPLAHDIIPASQVKQRPGGKRQLPGFVVIHETDNHNAGADAAMHNRYLHNGAEGRTAGWHFTVDDHSIYQHIPIDEVTWQAADGAGPGNMSGISCELCVNAGIDTIKARHNAEALCGGILKALGMAPDRIKRHWDFNAGSADRHHCPDTIMNDGYWETFVLNAARLTNQTPAPAFATPAPISWDEGDIGEVPYGDGEALAFKLQVKVIRKQIIPQVSETDARQAGPLRKKNTLLTAIGSVKDPHGNAYVILRDRTRVKRSDVRPLVPVAA